MRKVALFMMTTLDGYFEGPNHDISWHNVDEEFDEFAAVQLDAADMLLFGHTTYDMMAGYWPTDMAKQDDPIITAKMNEHPKLVFSRHDFQPEWHGTRLIKDNLAAEFAKIKAEGDGDLLVFGSSNLCVSLLQQGLLDEVRFMVSPVIIGAGTPLFAGLTDPVTFALTQSRPFSSGNVLLTYSRLSNVSSAA